MKNFDLGREFQVLESRIEQLEHNLNGHHNGTHMRGEGLALTRGLSAGVAPQTEPQLWKAEKAMALPPFLPGLLGLSHRHLQFDVLPESKTWGCTPEPLILFIKWDDGRTDEFYRLQNQTFSIIKIQDPNTGIISCAATYAAQLVASGKAVSHIVPNGGGYFMSRFNITLRNAQGAAIDFNAGPWYPISSCQENRSFIQTWEINPGLYDLVTSATWNITGDQTVDRC